MKQLACLLALLLALFAGGASAGVAPSSVSITPNTGAYSAGQCLGGVLTVLNLVQPQGNGGTILTSLMLIDPTAANASVDYLIFNAQPVGTYTDHATCALNTADVARLIGVVSNTAATCITDGGGAKGICIFQPGLTLSTFVSGGGPVKSSAIWIVPIMRGTPTYGATTLTLFVTAIPS